MEKRYHIIKLTWRRTGPRRGLLRKKSWVQTSVVIGKTNNYTDAEIILSALHMYTGESAYIHDRASVWNKYPQKRETKTTPPITIWR